ncbi:MAG: hypothetical protein HRU38_11080 [Saccharospirillaceae bacterium]|nr:hypothetical protein [Pseudomonadales bacterium]NRB79197.1 hypothetical protein [Saccharospirillaceae bacterium]
MVILLNGNINSGKTTIAKYITAMDYSIAHIEVDSLREFIHWMGLQESIKINLENALSVAINFHNRNISSIITYPLSDEDYRFVTEKLTSAGIKFCVITLFTQLSQLKSNRGNRELTDWELTRIDELYTQGLTQPSFGSIIDNSKQSISQSAQQVLDLAQIK